MESATPFLAIITPTYNRSSIIHNCYESLKSQTDYDFVWVVVDDGGTDNTKEVVLEFKKNALFEIIYIYRENRGMNAAVQAGLELVDTKFVLKLDSDDALTNNAVEIIKDKWKKWKINEKIGVISFLVQNQNGVIVGEHFPGDNYISNHIECRINKKINGDKTEIFRTSIFKDNINCFTLSYSGMGTILCVIGRKYDTVYYNRAIVIKNYLPDGISKSKKKNLKKMAGMMYLSNEYMHTDIKFSVRLNRTVIFGALGFVVKIKVFNLLRQSNMPFLSFICLFPSYILYKKWKVKYDFE